MFELTFDNLNSYLSLVDDLKWGDYIDKVTPSRFDEIMILYNLQEDIEELNKLNITDRYRRIEELYGVKITKKLNNEEKKLIKEVRDILEKLPVSIEKIVAVESINVTGWENKVKEIINDEITVDISNISEDDINDFIEENKHVKFTYKNVVLYKTLNDIKTILEKFGYKFGTYTIQRPTKNKVIDTLKFYELI